MRIFRKIALLAVAAVLAPAASAQADDVKLRVNVFPGAQDLAVFAAQDKGFFAKRGLAVELQFTPTSQAQRDGLVNGSFEIAQAGVDNAVYLVENNKADVIIVAGGDNSMNELIVRPEIRSYKDIRGKTVVVDAPNTAYAFQLYRILADHGLKQGDYKVLPKGGPALRLQAMRDDPANVASMIYLPWYVMAEKDGYKSMGSVQKLIGPYQGSGVWVLRSWAKANDAVLVKYLQGMISGLRWAMDPKNRDEAAAMLAQRLKVDLEIARRAVAAATGPGGGLAKDARFDMKGFAATLKLRQQFSDQPNAPIPPAEKYLDLSYYKRAIAGL